MPKTTHTCLISTVRESFRLALCIAVLAGSALAQVGQNPPNTAPNAPAKDNVADAEAMARLKHGDFFPADINRIAKAGAVQAIPDLEKQFELTPDPVSKISIASALVRLGDKDPAWWNYLAQGAADAIASDAPSPWRFDSKGKALPDVLPSPELIAWAKVHNLTDVELDTMVSEFLAKVTYLGESGDRRAIPLLRQALSSSNYMIQTFAAQGLAELQDKASIPLIIEACREAPADAAVVIARSLLDFNDPQAQSAARAFRPPQAFKQPQDVK